MNMVVYHVVIYKAFNPAMKVDFTCTYFWLDAYDVDGEELNNADDGNESQEEPSFTLNEEFLEYLRKSEKRRQGITLFF